MLVDAVSFLWSAGWVTAISVRPAKPERQPDLNLRREIGAGGNVVYNITQVSFRQGLCPPGLLGRMNATMRFLLWGTMPFGGLIGGALGAAIGVRQTLFVAAAGESLAFLPVFLSPLRRMRELPGGQDPLPGDLRPA